MNVQFLSTIAVITPDPPRSRLLYVDALRLPLEGEADDYQHSEHVGGCKSFGIWPLSEAAAACFGTPEWPADRPVPQVSIEFDVEDAADKCRKFAGEGIERTDTRTEGAHRGQRILPWVKGAPSE
jgi:hypothetical protein